MAQLWELLPSIQVQRSPAVRETLPDSSAWGDEHIYDIARPTRTLTFAGRGLSLAECEALETECLTRGSESDVDASNGETYSGKLISVSYEQIEGTNLYEATIQIRVAVT